jgi:hypothetical protein
MEKTGTPHKHLVTIWLAPLEIWIKKYTKHTSNNLHGIKAELSYGCI